MSDMITRVTEGKKSWIVVVGMTTGIVAVILKTPPDSLDKILRYWPYVMLPTILWVLYNVGSTIKDFLEGYLKNQLRMTSVWAKLESKLDRLVDAVEAFRVRLEQVENALALLYGVLEKRKELKAYENGTGQATKYH